MKKVHFPALMNARTGSDTVLSLLPKENTSDMWLSPLNHIIVGQCPTPSLAFGPSSLQSSSWIATALGGMPDSAATSMSSCPHANAIRARVERKPSKTVNAGAAVSRWLILHGIDPLNSGGFLSALISSPLAFCESADYISSSLVQPDFLV